MGENIALVDVETRSAEDAITAMHRNWLFSAAHRAAMFQSDFRELGYAQVMGRYSGMDVSIGVQNFAHSGTAAFVTGVVYNDRNGDASYSVGEGRSGIGLRILDGDSTTSAEAGAMPSAARWAARLRCRSAMAPTGRFCEPRWSMAM
ncbi:hypothetical protein ACFSHQ_15050 [Gemmobacter lanyuensis]